MVVLTDTPFLMAAGRTAVAQVERDDVDLLARLPDHLPVAVGDVAVGGPVEPVTADAVLRVQVVGDGVEVGLFGQGGVEGRVEDRDLGDLFAEDLGAGVDALEVGRVVQGARSAHSSICLSTSSSMRTDLVNFSAPWTTRWPMAWRSSQPWTPWILVVGSSIQALIRMMAARWSRTGSTPLNGAPPSAWRLMIASLVPTFSMRPLAIQRSLSDSKRSRSVLMIWNLTDELPQFRTKMFMNATSPSWCFYNGVNMKNAYYHEISGIVHILTGGQKVDPFANATPS